MGEDGRIGEWFLSKTAGGNLCLEEIAWSLKVKEYGSDKWKEGMNSKQNLELASGIVQWNLNPKQNYFLIITVDAYYYSKLGQTH